MPDVIVVGDGPAGLSAALFTAKNGLDTLVFGQDDSSMHKALLRNYLGLEEVGGSEFLETARAQVEAQGAELVAVDRNNETSVDNVYAAGWTVRPEKI